MISGDGLDRQCLHLLGFEIADFRGIADREAHQGFADLGKVGNFLFLRGGIPCAEDGDGLLDPFVIREDNDGADVDGFGISPFEIGSAGVGDFALEGGAAVIEIFFRVFRGLVFEVLAEVAVGFGDFYVLAVLRDFDADEFWSSSFSFRETPMKRAGALRVWRRSGRRPARRFRGGP